MSMKMLSHYTHYITYTLICAIVLGVCAYVFLVQQAIVHTAERERLEQSIAELVSETSDLKFQAIALGKDITLERALAYGFVEAEDTRYLVRGAGSAVALRDTNF